MELSELKRRFGKVVLRRRLEAQLTQEDLADATKIHRNHLSLIERGKHMPTLATIQNVAAAFGISMSGLMSEVESEEAPEDEPPALARGRPRKQGRTKKTAKAKKK